MLNDNNFYFFRNLRQNFLNKFHQRHIGSEAIRASRYPSHFVGPSRSQVTGDQPPLNRYVLGDMLCAICYRTNPADGKLVAFDWESPLNNPRSVTAKKYTDSYWKSRDSSYIYEVNN